MSNPQKSFTHTDILHLQNEVECWLKNNKRTISRNEFERYRQGPQPTLMTQGLGLSTPVVRSTLKANLTINQLPEVQAAQAWHFVFMNSDIFEALCAALYFFWDPIRYDRSDVFWIYFKDQAHRIDNWVHSDQLSKLVAKSLENDFKAIFPVLKSWNQSVSPWLQRQSLVGLFYYSAMRKSQPPVEQVLHFVRRHLQSDHYYVQKAVGWTLRETHNVYPQIALEFLKEHIRELSSYAWSAATEKMQPKVKEGLKELRKKS
jgi:3-methyladenine DNA glycosylase AlkD